MNTRISRIGWAMSALMWLVTAIAARADFPELTPFEQIPGSPQIADAFEVHPFAFEDWTLESRLRKQSEIVDWTFDPWGLSSTATFENERGDQSGLRYLHERSRRFKDIQTDSLLELYDGMRAKTEPTGKVKIRQEVTDSLWHSKAKFDVPDFTTVRPEPYLANDWRAEETMRLSMPMWEPLFVFGHFNSNADSFQYRDLTAVAKTGFGVRWVPLPKGEVMLRGGPMVSYTDTSLSTAKGQERSQFAVELLAKMPLFGPWQLEYSGASLTSALPSDPNQINQDLRIALPIGKSSEFYFGAKQRFDYGAATTLLEKRQLYLGVELKH